MKQKKIQIPQEEVNKIQRADLELASIRDNVAYILDMHKDESDGSFLDSAVFRTYEDRQMERYSTFEGLKADLERKYVAPNFPNAKWMLDYQTATLTITY